MHGCYSELLVARGRAAAGRRDERGAAVCDGAMFVNVFTGEEKATSSGMSNEELSRIPILPSTAMECRKCGHLLKNAPHFDSTVEYGYISDLAAAWTAAAKASTEAAAATADLLPRMGRARTHGEHSVGTPDPGAHSLALIASAVGAMLADPTLEEN